MEFRIAEQCICCSSTKRKLVFSYTGFESIEFNCYKCKDCSLLYASPQPIINETSLNEIYDGKYYKNYFGAGNDYTNEDSEKNKILVKILRREFEYYASFLVELKTPQGVLDIGCGDGRFLDHFVKLGWDCYGIEPSSFVAELAKKRNITLLDTSVLKLDNNKKFDFIFLDNVIEHLDFPATYLQKAYSLLNPGGVIVLKTPNSGGILERTETLLLSLSPKPFVSWFMKKLYEKFNLGSGAVHRYGNLHPPVHLSTFNKKSMSMAMAKVGFYEENIIIISGSEYFYRWRVKQPRVVGLFNKMLKLMKRIGDLTGNGEMLVTIGIKQTK